MLVKNWMSRPAITIDVDAMLPQAIKLLNQHKIHMLPVIEGERLVGIVTELDLRKAAGVDADPLNSSNPKKSPPPTMIREVMAKNPITVPYHHTIEETAELLRVYSISGVPVVDEQEKIVGIITKTDIFNFVIILAGGANKGVQLGLELIDRPGSVKEITDTIRDYGARISSIFSTPHRAGSGYRHVYIRMYDVDRPSLLRIKALLKEKTNLLYIVDHMDKTRETF
jgi:acetoin utilization protein AcuB